MHHQQDAVPTRSLHRVWRRAAIAFRKTLLPLDREYFAQHPACHVYERVAQADELDELGRALEENPRAARVCVRRHVPGFQIQSAS
jgi:hypothetical protein